MRILVGKNHPWAENAAAPPEPGAVMRSELEETIALLQQAAAENADAVVLQAAIQEPGAGHAGEAAPQPRSLVLCLHPLTEPLEVQSIVSTACAFLLAAASPDEVARIVTEVHPRRCVGASLPPAPGPAAATAGLEELSAREKFVLTLLAQEKTSKEIAGILGLSARTVDAQRSALMKKLGLQSTVGLACYAVRTGLVGP